MAFVDAEKHEIIKGFLKSIHLKDGITDIAYERPKLWAAAQAIQDEMNKPAFRSAISVVIDTATSPDVLTNAQKKRLFGYVIGVMFRLEVV